MPTPGGLFRQVVYELKRMHASTSGSHFYHHGSAENLAKPLHSVRARELLVPRDRMHDASQVDFENNNAVGPQDESGPCARPWPARRSTGSLSAPSLSSRPTCTVYSLCKELVDIGLKNPNSRISKYATPMEVDLMRGLALQSMHRKIAVVAARSWADSFLRRMGRYAPRPHHPPAAAPGHGGGAGGDEEDDDDDFVDDALAGNECRFTRESK